MSQEKPTETKYIECFLIEGLPYHFEQGVMMFADEHLDFAGVPCHVGTQQSWESLPRSPKTQFVDMEMICRITGADDYVPEFFVCTEVENPRKPSSFSKEFPSPSISDRFLFEKQRVTPKLKKKIFTELFVSPNMKIGKGKKKQRSVKNNKPVHRLNRNASLSVINDFLTMEGDHFGRVFTGVPGLHAHGDSSVAQTSILPLPCKVVLDNFLAASSSSVLDACAKRIFLNETVTLTGGRVVGKLWLCWITLQYSLLQSIRGEVNIFQKAFWNWVRLTKCMGARVIRRKGYYTEDYGTLEQFETYLLNGPALDIPFSNDTLSWPTGALDAQGRNVLETVSPTDILIEDLMNHGVELTLEMWTRTYGDQSIILMDEFESLSTSAAGFAVLATGEDKDYRPFRALNCEVFVPRSMLDISEMCILQPKNGEKRRGAHWFPCFKGTVSYSLKSMKPDLMNCYIIPSPSYISLSQYLTQVLATVTAADFRYNEIKDYNSSSALTQTSASVLLGITPGDFIMGCLATIGANWAGYSATLSGGPELFEGSVKLFSGTAQIPPSTALNLQIPQFICESISDLAPKVIPANKAAYDAEAGVKHSGIRAYFVGIPALVSQGLTYANGIDNGTSAYGSVSSILETFYGVDAPAYILGVPIATNYYSATFDATDNSATWFHGTSFKGTFKSFSNLMNLIQGNVAVGTATPAHETVTTLRNARIYSYPSNTQAAWDYMCQIDSDKWANSEPLLGDYMAEYAGVLLPYVLTVDDGSMYMSIKDMTYAITSDAPVLDFLIATTQEMVHFLYGEGSESSKIVEKKIVQTMGGGFFRAFRDRAKKMGQWVLPILGKLGGAFLDSKVPGLGDVLRTGTQVASEMLGKKISVPHKDRVKLLKWMMQVPLSHPNHPALRHDYSMVIDSPSFQSEYNPRMKHY